MRTNRNMALGYQAAVCGLCHGGIDFNSGFFFDTEGPLSIVHPDCMAYHCEIGAVRPGDTVDRTCGDNWCIRPDHLTVVHPNETCRKDGWIVRPDYAIGCTTDADTASWSFDHFHALIGGQACDCRHVSAAQARLAHGLRVER